MSEKELRITGTLIWYYYICRREVWLMAHNLAPDQDDTNVVLGRFFGEESYSREKKEISFGNLKFDVIKKDNQGLVLAEIKKSSKFINSARMQLAYYLSQLREKGIEARGELLFPREKRKEYVALNEDLIYELESAKKDITRIVAEEIPPTPKRITYCGKCAYNEFCWS